MRHVTASSSRATIGWDALGLAGEDGWRDNRSVGGKGDLDNDVEGKEGGVELRAMSGRFGRQKWSRNETSFHLSFEFNVDFQTRPSVLFDYRGHLEGQLDSVDNTVPATA